MVCVCHRIYESSGSLWFVYATGCWDSPTTPTINFQSMGGGGGDPGTVQRGMKFANLQQIHGAHPYWPQGTAAN